MARLPIPGSDDGKWGQILNEYLSQSLDESGNLKPGLITKADVGLGSVDNTSDVDKPVSTATQAALAAKLSISALDNETATKIADSASSTASAIDDTVGSAIASAQIGTPSGHASPAQYPNFVATNSVAWSASDTGLETVYWPSVLDCNGLAMPGRYLFMCSTDHADPQDNNYGIAYAWGNSPYSANNWSHMTISGLPAQLTQIETPTPNLRASILPSSGYSQVDNAQIILTFHAQDTSNNNAQNTYTATSSDGITWTYLGEVNKFPANSPGDGHGGYMGPLMPWGNAVGAWSLAGGTARSSFGFRVTRDFVNWTHIGSTRTAQNADWKFPDWPNTRYFVWQNELWALLVKSSVQPVSLYQPETHMFVAKVARDLVTLRTEPVPVLTSISSGFIGAIVTDKDRLVAYYRHGGNTGEIRTAVAEAGI